MPSVRSESRLGQKAGKVGKPGMVLRTNSWWQHSTYKMVRTCLYGYRTQQVAIRSYCLPHIYFEKAEAAYCQYRLGHHTTVLHGVAAVVYFTEYFSVLLSACPAYVSQWIIWRMLQNCSEHISNPVLLQLWTTWVSDDRMFCIKQAAREKLREGCEGNV